MRLRRKAIELLHHILQKRPFPETAAAEEATVLAALAQRCSDQDADVRRVAFSCLHNSVPFKKLVNVLTTAQWRRIFEEGLSERAGGGAAAAAQSRHAQEICFASKRLLEKYLRQDEVENENENGIDNGDSIANVEVESKAVHRLHELINGTTAVSDELMAVLAEMLTERDLTTCAI